MPNWNPLTNAVGGAGAANPVNTYYQNAPTNFGEYQYVKLTEIVDNFVATYIGEGKILANVLRGDVNFHAHRALQELSYDTLKSCKSQEIEVCPSLKMPLPHDYVNYVKITSVDANGIEHVIYPTRHTSHPFAIEQDDCGYEFNTDGTLKHQETCVTGVETTCDGTPLNNFITWFNSYRGSYPVAPNIAETIYDTTVFIADQNEAGSIVIAMSNDLCNCFALIPGEEIGPNCGDCINDIGGGENTRGGGYASTGGANCQDFNDWFRNGNFPTFGPFTSVGSCELTSNAWTNYQSGGGNSIALDSSQTTNLAVDNSNYFQNKGQRYGLQPEHAQMNGSFYIDCMRGNIHFGSNFSGKTVILHYISDHHGTKDEQIVHKFAEEAMYKWIAYGCAQARVDVDPNTIARLKKERFAETRKAKIRLSNIKIEEIAQIMRNKSKWIKH